jgi:hypothetical protein
MGVWHITPSFIGDNNLALSNPQRLLEINQGA